MVAPTTRLAASAALRSGVLAMSWALTASPTLAAFLRIRIWVAALVRSAVTVISRTGSGSALSGSRETSTRRVWPLVTAAFYTRRGLWAS
jgi:hypothetical protein